MKQLPIAKQYWSILSPFGTKIKQACTATLQGEQLSALQATKCLASLSILDQSNVDSLLKTLIQLRGKAFQRTLSDDIDLPVKAKILNSLKVLVETLELIYKCFICSESGSDSGLLIEELAVLTSDKTLPTISLMDCQDVPYIRELPDIIAKYK